MNQARPYQKLQREDLYSLERYAEIRDAFRREVMAHKARRRLALGENVMLFFEDRLLMHYQIQEMLRAEKIFEADGIQEELDAYNPLIPDGGNWKATMMIQYEDVAERERRLKQLVGIENTVWVQVEGCDRVFAIADEDLERSTEDKTSSVHFLRFELDDAMIAAVHQGRPVRAGISHDEYRVETQMPPTLTEALAADLKDTKD